MRLGIDYGRAHADVEVDEKHLVAVHRHPPVPPLADPAAAVRQALEHPQGFPALRRALTPDDHVVVVVDEHLPRLAELLAAVLEHVSAAHVRPDAITLLFPSSSTNRDWIAELPEAYRAVRVEVHDPADRKRLSYLATTRQNRRIYLNRTAVDADQLVVLARRDYDPLLGYSGSEGAIYPALSDEATRQEMCGRLSMAAPGERPWPTRQEATEVAWLLGAPFMIHVIEGAGDDLLHVMGGLADTAAESQRLLDAHWRASVDQPADTVVAALSGDPARHDFADLARAVACAGRVVKPDGRIVVLSEAGPTLGTGAELVRQAEDPGRAIDFLRKQMPADMAAAFQWASTAQHARVYLLSGLGNDTAEELFATPLDNARQVQRLLNGNGICLFLSDAHKMLAVPSKHRNGR